MKKSNSKVKNDAGARAQNSPAHGRISERLRRSVRADKMTLEETAHFNKKELRKLFTEFRRISRNGYLDMDGFRQSMGVLGMVQDSLLCQRLFSVFNKSKTGFVSFEEYANGLGILMKGTVDEKLDFAFSMTDIDGSGEITYEELMITVQSIMRIYSGIMGNSSIATLDERKVKKMFKQLDKNGDGLLTLDEYKRGMKRHPEFVSSLRGSDIYENAQVRQSNIQRKNLKKYMKSCTLLERKVQQAIEIVEKQGIGTTSKTNLETGSEPQSHYHSEVRTEIKKKSVTIKTEVVVDEERKEIVRHDSERTLSLGELSDDELKQNVNKTDENVDSNAPEEKSEEKLLELLKRIKSKLEEMSTDEFLNENYKPKPFIRTKIKGDKKDIVGQSENNGEQRRKRNSVRVNKEFINHKDASPNEYGYTSDGHCCDTDGYETDGKSETMKTKSLDNYLKPSSTGSTVFFGHKNWDLVINVMKGIQMAVGRCSAEASRPISVFDFGVKEKYTLIAGQKTTNNNVSKVHDDIDLDARSCRFVDYAPFVFNKLREHFGIRNEDYVHSIGPGNMISNLMLGSLSSLAEQGSEGKSGSFFYITSDGLYMVKTLSREEHKQLRAILPQYYHHVTSAGKSTQEQGEKTPDTLLTWILGCHIVRLSKHSKIGADKIYLVVMNNILNTDLELQYRYDLKGSWKGRVSSEAERKVHKKTLKDVDFTELKQKIRIGPERKKVLMSCIKRDCDFLEHLGLIDYSLLLGIHKQGLSEKVSTVNLDSLATFPSDFDSENGAKGDTPIFRQTNGGMSSVDGSETYVMGILDFLTVYSSRKKAEKVLRTIQYLDSHGMSVQPPKKYASRFVNFMDKIIE